MATRPFQFSLATLLAVMTVACCVTAYLKMVGAGRFLLAIGPPLVIGAIINSLMLPELWVAPPRSAPGRRVGESLPHATRLALVLGFVLWIPILLIYLTG